MFKIDIQDCDGNELLVVETTERKLARAMSLLGEENDLKVTVTEEVKPRVLKFKGVEAPK